MWTGAEPLHVIPCWLECSLTQIRSQERPRWTRKEETDSVLQVVLLYACRCEWFVRMHERMRWQTRAETSGVATALAVSREEEESRPQQDVCGAHFSSFHKVSSRSPVPVDNQWLKVVVVVGWTVVVSRTCKQLLRTLERDDVSFAALQTSSLLIYYVL